MRMAVGGLAHHVYGILIFHLKLYLLIKQHANLDGTSYINGILIFHLKLYVLIKPNTLDISFKLLVKGKILPATSETGWGVSERAVAFWWKIK